MSHIARAFFLLLVLIPLVMVACGDGCDKDLPEPQNGPNGEQVALSQLTDGSTIPCNGLQSGNSCFFTVNFTVVGLGTPVTARLLVAITKTDKGEDFCGDPFPQGTGILVTPTQGGGQLTGQLGPPVSSAVRFDLAIELLDSTGRRIAVSAPVRNLQPG
jgi:hypothetical protein